MIPFLAQVFHLKTDNVDEDAAAMVSDASSAKLGISGGAVFGWILYGEPGADDVPVALYQ